MITDIQGVIFDCDGVLVDSEPLGLGALGTTLKSFGFELGKIDLESFCGRTDTDSIQELCEDWGISIDIDEYLDRKMADYLATLDEHGLKPFPGVRELLGDLNRQETPIAVASSGPPPKIAANLQTAGLQEAFSVIVSAVEVERGKPAPDVFLEAARRLGVPPERCAVVEDAPAGLQAAKAAGMYAVAVAHTFSVEELQPLSDRAVEKISDIDASQIVQEYGCAEPV